MLNGKTQNKAFKIDKVILETIQNKYVRNCKCFSMLCILNSVFIIIIYKTTPKEIRENKKLLVLYFY